MITVIIPTYKNKSQLIKNLRHNLLFLTDCEIIVVNDDPSGSLKNDLAAFATVVLIENKKNYGFGQTINNGARKAKNPYLMLLNDDVILHDESYKKSVEHFKKNGLLFAVSFAQTEKNGEAVGKNRLFWEQGLAYHSKAANRAAGYNGWAEGGACIIDRKKFSEFEGFDPIFAPFYWEDIDLSYRAWKRGYQILFDPAVNVEHHHESTISRYFSKQTIEIVAFRNQLIFIWKNITDGDLVRSHIFFLPLHLLIFLLKGRLTFLKGFFSALSYMKLVLEKRKRGQKKNIVSDRSIFTMFSHE